MNGQLQAPAALLPRKEPLSQTEEKVGWVSEPVSSPTGNQNPDHPPHSLVTMSTELQQSMCVLKWYEGWNFNSGNYLFTTDTK